MKWYCEKCKKIHSDNELCPQIKKQFAQHPEWIKEMADFTTVAGEYALVTGQHLDKVANGINKLSGSSWTYEGTHQVARDIQVFKRLNAEPFSKSGIFSSPETAKTYLESVQKEAANHPGALTSFKNKLAGYGQEVDWLMAKKSELSSIWEKSSLLENNAPGIDGVTINRFSGKQLSQTTIKASRKPLTANSTGITDIKEAISKGTATPRDIIFGPKGTGTAARNAGLTNPVIEKNTVEQTQQSVDRLSKKILSKQAVTAPTTTIIGQQALKGTIVGAAVGITVSTITSYIRYKNGELSIKEAFSEVAEGTLSGALVGSAMGVITIFLPGGPIGFVAGMAISIYISTACQNILDEIFGKGAFGAILNSSGYVYGMTMNLADYYQKINENQKLAQYNISKAQATQEIISQNFDLFEEMKGR